MALGHPVQAQPTGNADTTEQGTWEEVTQAPGSGGNQGFMEEECCARKGQGGGSNN